MEGFKNCTDNEKEEKILKANATNNESTANDICKFYLENKCRFGDECRNRHEGTPIIKLRKKYETRKKNNESIVDKFEKKKRMKTAEDVIKRLQWDPLLPQESFVIGYLDRFLGVIEENFTTFTWEDLASVDYEVLAIPQHRIQYFKYKNEKVWNKSERLDIVFGSTGSNIGILEFMDQVDRRIQVE